MLIGMQLFIHTVLPEHVTQLLRVILSSAIRFDNFGLVTLRCLRKYTIEDLGYLIFRCMHDGCGIPAIVNKDRTVSVPSYGGDLAHVKKIETHVTDRAGLTCRCGRCRIASDVSMYTNVALTLGAF